MHDVSSPMLIGGSMFRLYNVEDGADGAVHHANGQRAQRCRSGRSPAAAWLAFCAACDVPLSRARSHRKLARPTIFALYNFGRLPVARPTFGGSAASAEVPAGMARRAERPEDATREFEDESLTPTACASINVAGLEAARAGHRIRLADGQLSSVYNNSAARPEDAGGGRFGDVALHVASRRR